MQHTFKKPSRSELKIDPIHFSYIGIGLLLVTFLISCEPIESTAAAPQPDFSLQEFSSKGFPFFGELEIDLTQKPELRNASEINFEVQPKPDYKAKPISATYTQPGKHFFIENSVLRIPVFGLYPNYENTVHLNISYGSDQAKLKEKIRTGRYESNDKSFWDPKIQVIDKPSRKLGFSYFLLESGGSNRHVIVDIDGELRWVLPYPAVAEAKRHGFGIVWFDPDALAFVLLREGDLWLSPLSFLVGEKIFSKKFAIDGSRFGFSQINQHHEIAPGKRGYLLNINANKKGTRRIESILLEVGKQSEMGRVLSEWDFGDIIADYMKTNGESKTAIDSFVHHGIDWLHINSAVYSPNNVSIIGSGRENFVIKVGYTDKKIKWNIR